MHSNEVPFNISQSIWTKICLSFLDQLRSVCILKLVLLERSTMLEITMAMNHVANKGKNIADLGAREM